MAPILTKGLRLRDGHFGSSSRSPPRLHFEVFVDPVLAEQPVSLTCVTGQHAAFRREYAADADVEIGGNRLAKAVGPFERIDEIEIRNFLEGRGGLPLPGGIVGTRRRETGVADQKTGHLVIGDVVGRGRRENDLGSSAANRFGDPAARIVIVEDRQVAEFQTNVAGANQRGGGPSFLSSDSGDCFGVVLGTSTVAGSHGRDRHIVAKLAQDARGCRRTEIRYRQGERATRVRWSIPAFSTHPFPRFSDGG